MATDKNLIPIAILLAGLVLSVTIFMVRTPETPTVAQGDINKTLPLTLDDHLLGDTDAQVVIATYTNLDCQFCKRFHEIMLQIISEYDENGNVAYVLRHFPIIDLHPHSGTHAKAAECAAKLGGEDAFWTFITSLHAAAPEAREFDPKNYSMLAPALGVSPEQLTSCVNGSEFDERVARDFENALLIGAKGTPFTVIMVEGMEPFAVSGFLPYDGMKAIIERTLSSI